MGLDGATDKWARQQNSIDAMFDPLEYFVTITRSGTTGDATQAFPGIFIAKLYHFRSPVKLYGATGVPGYFY